MSHVLPLKTHRNHPILILVLCFALAFLFGVVWVVVMTFSLPPSDGAFGTMPFDDPLVFPIMSIFASIGAILVYPFTYFSLRDRPLPKSLAILGGCVLLEIVLVTPIIPPLGFIGSFVAYGIGLTVARALTGNANSESGPNNLQFSLRTLLIVVS
ncbi:MAG TPA: hypothetical protein VFW73_10915, partial [Lacipirellulaceae bacterium]|nr:hypothetical protein [Lacipirellulaceae bacterium]